MRARSRCCAGAVLVGGLILVATPALGQASRNGLIRHDEALAVGLERAWAQQIALNREHDHLASLSLLGDTLYGQSSEGVIHALDAETGLTRWTTRIGRRDSPTQPPAAANGFVAATNGHWLYLLDGKNGHALWERKLEFLPCAAPAMDAERVYVPLMNGTIASYRVDLHLIEAETDPARRAQGVLDAVPFSYRAKGEPAARPILIPKQIAWTTLNGRLYAGRLGEPGTNFEIRAAKACRGAPAYRRPLLYFTSDDGWIHAVQETNGRERWRHYAAAAIWQSPLVAGDAVLFATATGRITCLDAATGAVRWEAPLGTWLLAASPERIYAADELNQMLVLNRTTGELVAQTSLAWLPLRLLNTDNDRLYLARPSGLVQCLHETGLAAPVAVAPVAAEAPPAEQQTPPADAGEEPAATDDAFGEEAADEAPADDPAEVPEP